VWKDRPRNDEASHAADAFLTFACSGMRETEDLARKLLDRYSRRRCTWPHSWMAV
jgi:hypothetical protein